LAPPELLVPPRLLLPPLPDGVVEPPLLEHENMSAADIKIPRERHVFFGVICMR
jgi:hypothetical protein